MNIGILGAGAWGTAIAVLLSGSGADIILYSNNQQRVQSINSSKTSPVFPEVIFSSNISATNNLEGILNCAFIFLALPVQTTYEVLSDLSKYDLKDKCFVVCSKGIEYKTLLLVSEIIEKFFPTSCIAVLSGPNFANEIMNGNYAASTVACRDLLAAKKIQKLLESEKFKTSITDDIISVQIAGSLKNVMAILCGIIRGKNYGNNTHAAVLTMGMREIIKFSLAKGGKIETLLGYSGIGDLILTCYSENSRNMKLGMDYVNGKIDLDSLAEGFYTLKSTIKLAQKLNIKDIPVFEAVYNIIYKKHNIDEVFKKLFLSMEQESIN